MNKVLVNFETAQLAAAKGFDVETDSFYDSDGYELSVGHQYANLRYFDTGEKVAYVNKPFNWNGLDIDSSKRMQFEWDDHIFHEYFTINCSAPLQSTLHRWLLKEHSIFIEISLYNWTQGFDYQIKRKNYSDNTYSAMPVGAPEKALEDGLKEALNLI